MGRIIKLLSWNVNGIRAVHKKGFLEWLAGESPDILCIQETKAGVEQLPGELIEAPGYGAYWHSARRKGYSGVAVYTREQPKRVETSLGADEHDAEGRFLRLDYSDFTLFNVYFPNGKSGSDRLAYKMKFYDAFLDYTEALRRERPNIVFVGDVNTAHNEIDLARPKENSKASGFLPVERAWMDTVVAHGYVDTFRSLHPDAVEYSWWDLKSRARERNIGWRIDYVFVTREMLGRVTRAFIQSGVTGSDHCPVGIELEVS
jgi:exodeoxyribonuclease III